VTAPRAEPCTSGPTPDRCSGGSTGRSALPVAAWVSCYATRRIRGDLRHRALRHCAEAAADAGIPALRFDYDGTGDSAGTDLDPDRLSAWIASVHGAQRLCGARPACDRVCFLGVRLGATLAALAASERSDVAGLIALAPVVSGRAYTRELRALQMASGADCRRLPTATSWR